MDLVALFRELRAPEVIGQATNVFAVAPIPGFASHRLGKDQVGAPALLLHIGRHEAGRMPQIELEHLSIQHDALCRMRVGDAEPREESFTLIRCRSLDPVLRRYFVSVLGAIVEQLGAAPATAEVTAAVKYLIELFKALLEPPKRTVQGLWAELFVIHQASDQIAALRAWHAEPQEAFDFTWSHQRIEVKSCSGATRAHSFALRQLRPMDGTDVVIASLFAERAGGGVTIQDLLVDIRRAVSAHDRLAARLESVVASSLGTGSLIGLEQGYDPSRARASLRFFDAKELPSIDPNLPPAIRNVRFELLMDTSSNLTEAVLAERRGLFAAIIPR